MVRYEAPDFLKGTFSWAFYGYFYANEPSIDLLSPELLISENPWIILASVLEHSKNGDFKHIHELKKTFLTSNEQGPDYASICLTADAGSYSDIQELKLIFEKGPDVLKAYAAQAAVNVGQLWLIPPMLKAWRSASGLALHETIGFAISSILEKQGGEIAEKAGVYAFVPETKSRIKISSKSSNQNKDGVTEFELLVQARLNELLINYSDKDVLWEGELFNALTLVEKLLDLVWDKSSKPYQGYFIKARHKLEASTGINLSGCYERGVLQPLNASIVLKSISNSVLLSGYKSGTRCFFSHQILD